MVQQPEHNAERDGGADTNLCDSSPEGAETGSVASTICLKRSRRNGNYFVKKRTSNYCFSCLQPKIHLLSEIQWT